MAKRPRDFNQLAKLVVDIASGEAEDNVSAYKRDSIANRGAAGGRVGGSVRANKLSPARRKEIAQLAAAARWKGQA